MRVVATFLMSMTILVSAIVSGCSGTGGDNAQTDTIGILPDTIRVATLYSPTSYFIYRDATLGYDYSLVKQFSEDNNVTFDIVIASNMNAMIGLLEAGEVDVIAYEIPITSEYKNRVLHCGFENTSSTMP